MCLGNVINSTFVACAFEPLVRVFNFNGTDLCETLCDTIDCAKVSCVATGKDMKSVAGSTSGQFMFFKYCSLYSITDKVQMVKPERRGINSVAICDDKINIRSLSDFGNNLENPFNNLIACASTDGRFTLWTYKADEPSK
ncbi:hypothetical protein HZS_5700 [Henneguya salminicola]|nr:hypothetical protein HZS_5700 [Henneguya salminicola]